MKSCDCHAAINWCHCLSADRTMTTRCAAVVGHAPRQRFHQQGSTNPCSDWNCHLPAIHFVLVPFVSFVLVSFFVLISVHRKKSKFTRLRNSSDFIHLQRIYFTFCSLLFYQNARIFPFLWKGNQSEGYKKTWNLIKSICARLPWNERKKCFNYWEEMNECW